MKTSVCTLFEGDYHKGVGVLTNSLVRNGFSGTVFAGFRGPLPSWAAGRVTTANNGIGPVDLQVTKDVRIQFVPVATKSHLTNYKPEFILSLWCGAANDLDALLYLDPDIVVNESWSYFEDWLQCGVALCEDVNSPLHATHPRREGWRRFYRSRGIELRGGQSVYVNGGAVGTRREDIEFLQLWKTMTDLMAEEIGGLSAAKVAGGQDFSARGFANCFDASDQDSLNAAVEAYSGQITILGREAMGLIPGHAVLPHALGSRKPWKTSYLAYATAGESPRLVDKVFWRNVATPIRIAGAFLAARKLLSITLASAVGRFYSRR